MKKHTKFLSSSLFRVNFLLFILIASLSSIQVQAQNCSVYVNFDSSGGGSQVSVTCDSGHNGGTVRFVGEFSTEEFTFGSGGTQSDYLFYFFGNPGEFYTMSVTLNEGGQDIVFGGEDGMPYEESSNDSGWWPYPCADFSIDSLNVTGIVNITGGPESVDGVIHYCIDEFCSGYDNIGSLARAVVTLRPLNPLDNPVVLDSNNGDVSIDTSTSTVTFSYTMPASTIPDGWYVDVVFYDQYCSQNITTFNDAGSFAVQYWNAGGSQAVPLLPDSTSSDGTFVFNDVNGTTPTPLWIDPPLAFGYVYEVTNDAKITGISGFPVGIDADGFVKVIAEGGFEVTVSINDVVDFRSLPGGGVSWFSVTEVSPVDGTDATAFPIQLVLDSTTDLEVTPLFLPDLTVGVYGKSGSIVGISIQWQGQHEVNYQLYTSPDLKQWTPKGDVIAGADAPLLTYAQASGQEYYRLGVVVKPVPIGGGGSGSGGVVVVVLPPPPLPPFP